MAYAIQHRTTKHFLTVRPSLDAGLHVSQHEQEAVTWPTMTEATIELLHLGEFSGAYDIHPIEDAE